MEATMTAATMIAQVESLPELIRGEFDRLDASARRLMNHNECLSVKRIVIAGCGDSHMAGVAAELSFEQLAGIATEPLNAMQAGRYGAPYFEKMFPRNPLVLGISVSGTVARTREALILARKEGALTVAITGNPAAPLAGIAERIFDCKVPDFAPAPGVRSYRISLLALYLLAIRLAEVRGRMTQDQASALRQQLKGTADTIEATVQSIGAKVRKLAESVADQTQFVFTGDGQNYASALFSAAKVIEAAGRHAIGQDTEEWAHLQYFVNVDTATPTFIISPGGRGHSRAGEMVEIMKRVGRTVVAVVPEGDQAIAGAADWVLPVVGQIPEIFTPMVYAVAGELFAAHLSDIVGEPPFRSFSGVYQNGNTIQTSAVMESIAI
ncbi:MAG TPA: SIS domain-containing protein [Roseiflexaceae bacterium]|jgi:glucosamine--fructose-6-phosphate aminotransferase (isomerizing)